MGHCFVDSWLQHGTHIARGSAACFLFAFAMLCVMLRRSPLVGKRCALMALAGVH